MNAQPMPNKLTQAVSMLAAGAIPLSGASSVQPQIPAPASKTELPGPTLRFIDALNRLELTETQRNQIRAIIRKHLPTIQPDISALVEAHRTLQDVVRTTPVNESAIRSQCARLATVEANLAVKRAFISQDIQAVLTPLQIQEFHKIVTEIRSTADDRLSRVASFLSGK